MAPSAVPPTHALGAQFQLQSGCNALLEHPVGCPGGLSMGTGTGVNPPPPGGGQGIGSKSSSMVGGSQSNPSKKNCRVPKPYK
eukprot:scaffold2065_cov359-Prasinococcus_capsulatus_cf.AAC.9